MFKKMLSALGLCVLVTACSPDSRAGASTRALSLAPEFKDISHWINSEPLRMDQLRGKVVLVEFWTYSCINCIHVMPYVKQWHERYHDQGLVVVGVHTPEYGYERITQNVESAVKRFGIKYAVAQDNAYATWNAYGNQYCPALYLVDQSGHVVYRHFGEGDYARTEAVICQVLGRAAAKLSRRSW